MPGRVGHGVVVTGCSQSCGTLTPVAFESGKQNKIGLEGIVLIVYETNVETTNGRCLEVFFSERAFRAQFPV